MKVVMPKYGTHGSTLGVRERNDVSITVEQPSRHLDKDLHGNKMAMDNDDKQNRTLDKVGQTSQQDLKFQNLGNKMRHAGSHQNLGGGNATRRQPPTFG